MNNARLSPDGHAVAFTSSVSGIAQVFLMLTSGGEPLQLTNDEGDKFINAFSPDGQEVFYRRSFGREGVWAVPTLGGAPRRVVSAFYMVPSPDGASIFYIKFGSFGIFRAGKSGLDEELVYNFEGTGLFFVPLLLFPGGNDLLAAASSSGFAQPQFHFYKIVVASHEAIDLGEVSGNPDVSGNPIDVVWGEPGENVLFSRTTNGLTNIWNYNLKDRSLTQITFGIGPDLWPMPDQGGKGIYFVNGKPSGFLTVYRVHSKESADIVSEDAAQPIISADGKRVMYIKLAAGKRHELWVSDIDGGNKLKLATGETLWTGHWAPDNSHLLFFETGAGSGAKAYVVGVQGGGLRQLPPIRGFPVFPVWSPDQKSVYVNVVEKAGSMTALWRWNVEGSNLERLMDNCCAVTDADPSGRYLLGEVALGERTGVYEVAISDMKCTLLLPGVETLAVTIARDGRSFLYAVASRGEVTIYRQPWREGKLIGVPQVALKVPFAFPLVYGGNAYDFSRDLSTIVYARPGGHADLYLLSQK